MQVATPRHRVRAAADEALGGAGERALIEKPAESRRRGARPAPSGRPGCGSGTSGALAGARGSGSSTMLRALLVGLLFWAPLPLGSNRPWSWSLLTVAVGGLLLAWCGAELRRPRIRSLPVPIWLAGALIGGALGWAWVQTVPSSSLAHPVWSWAAEIGTGARPRPSVDPAAGREAILRFLNYVGVFWLCFALARERTDARRLLSAILTIAVAYAVWGLVRHFAGIEHLFWHVRSPYGDSLSATFVNRNHAATYLNIGVIIAATLLWERLRWSLSTRPSGAWVAALGELMERSGLLVMGALCLVVASLLTGSRGGLLSLGVGLATVLCLGLSSARAGGRTVAIAAGLAVLTALGLLRLGGEVTLERLARIDQELSLARETRLALWQNCLELVRERPLMGHGYGTFEQLFQLTRDARFERIWDAAHNTYLEHAVELGLPATFALYGAMAVLVGCCARGAVRRCRDQALPLAAVGVSALVASHALVDFSLQIPAVAITYAAVMAIGCAQAAPSARRSEIHRAV
jgi:O-antigen ligase